MAGGRIYRPDALLDSRSPKNPHTGAVTSPEDPVFSGLSFGFERHRATRKEHQPHETGVVDKKRRYRRLASSRRISLTSRLPFASRRAFM
jgi:hypothetical protein